MKKLSSTYQQRWHTVDSRLQYSLVHYFIELGSINSNKLRQNSRFEKDSIFDSDSVHIMPRN